MEYLWLFLILGTAYGQTAPTPNTPKAILVKKVSDFVTGFLTEPQIAKAIDITAVDIHSNKQAEEIMNDLYGYLKTALSPEQLRVVNESRQALTEDLGEEAATNLLERIKKIVAYAVTPAVEMVRANDETPDLAYMAMSRQLTPDFVHGVISLVRDMLTPTEWKSVKLRFAPMLKIILEELCECKADDRRRCVSCYKNKGAFMLHLMPEEPLLVAANADTVLYWFPNNHKKEYWERLCGSATKTTDAMAITEL